MNRNERIDDSQASLRAAFGDLRAQVWTALPGIIESYNPAAQTVVIQGGLKVPVRADDGTVTTVELPPLVDCPVQFPSGGNSTLTFPVARGDECLVVFASRCIDAWWQSGGVQELADTRMHSLSDGFALLGFRSQPRVLANVSTTSAQLRSDDGATFIELNPTAGTLKLVAPGGLEIDAPTVKVDAGTSVEVNSPQSTFDGALTVKGIFTFLAGLVGSTAEGVAATITGTINFIGSLTSNGKRIDDGHTHGGVQPGDGSSGPVN
ncbi:Gp138 family membrane-puncturing spike protein [Burkholderia gladioli]|uniref:Gp138 family membrane-puncturing spike protein n=1 Tax=Burkholderia gladioli TaxID=28095 RepID=UPI00163F24DA|nr:Gp138 family membrane-puncturing spike protein [Burkholderia gladioli]